MVLLTLSALAYGCGGNRGVRKTTNVPVTERPVYLQAAPTELLDRYNALANNLHSLDATVDLKPSAGSAYSGVITEYHDVKAFMLASRPYNIRMIGQVPVIGTNVFDMASNGKDFEVSIPSKNKFLVGPVALNHQSANPIENLRPQHLIDALLWPEVHKQEVVLPEEYNDETAHYYILNVLRGGYQSELLWRIWFDRSDLHLARLESLGPKGVLVSDVRYGDWRPADTAGAELKNYPHSILIERPHDDYHLELTFTKISLNEAIPEDRFNLQPPPGQEVVHLTDGPENNKP
jgi:hypothetical protein